MVQVYFETGGYAELVAIFEHEEVYDALYDHLLEIAKKSNFTKVTESVVDGTLNNGVGSA